MSLDLENYFIKKKCYNKTITIVSPEFTTISDYIGVIYYNI